MMIQKILYVSILIFFSKLTFGQTKIVDIIDNEPIPFVHVISKEGVIIGTSNLKGVVEFMRNSISPINPESVVSFHHISYRNKEMKFGELLKSDTIKLSSEDILLPEVNATNKKQEAVSLVLKGFFRSYQIENGVPKYYTDGIVEYYILNNQLKNRVIQHRSFRNKKLVDSEKKRTNTIRIVAACVPYINAKPEIDELDSDYSFEKTGNQQVIKKDNCTVGFNRIDKLSGSVLVNVDLIAPAKEKARSLFNYTSRITSINITEKYSAVDSLKILKDDLLSRKEYRKIFFKHKKDKDEVEIDVLHEFYVFEKKYLNKSEAKEVSWSPNFSIKESCNYTNEYWEEIKKYGIEKLPANIERLLGTTLEKY